jgi:hypothetical protein
MAKDLTEYVRVAKSKSTTVALPQPVARRGKSPDTVARSTRTHSFRSNTFRDLHGVLSHGAALPAASPSSS